MRKETPNIGFDLKQFEKLVRTEENNFWFRSRNKLITHCIKKFFGTGESMLEIGCGTGYVLSGIEKAFPQLELSGSELFEEGLNIARMRVSRANLFQLDARNIRKLNTYDVIGAFDVLEHIDEDQEVLNQLYSVCKQGVIITVPQHPFLWSKADEIACHVRRYTCSALVHKCKLAGFQVVYKTSFVSLLFPLMAASRFGKTGSAEAELDINPVINRVFEKVMAMERALIKLGVSFPVGGSLLIVAKR